MLDLAATLARAAMPRCLLRQRRSALRLFFAYAMLLLLRASGATLRGARCRYAIRYARCKDAAGEAGR